jgi:hypothetical protein
LVHLTSGAPILDLDFTVARRAGPGRLVAFGGLKAAPHVPLPPEAARALPDKNRASADAYQKAVAHVRSDPKWKALFAVRFDQQTVRDRAGPALTLLAQRPPPRPADRAAVKVVRPEPPAAWAVPAAGKPAAALAADTSLPDWPATFGDSSAAVITFARQTQPELRWEVHWQRLDLRTGKPLGQPLVLWPWATLPGKADPPTVPPAALTADGKRLALADLSDAARVDIWDDAGTRLLGLVPDPNRKAIDWLGWSGDGRLLTLAGGKLTAWDVPAGKAVYEVAGEYKAPLQLAPGRAWLVAPAEAHVDLLDTATGRCLGRCREEGLDKDWHGCSLSPDGRTLVRTRDGDLVDRRAPQMGQRARAHVWDLTTGKHAGSFQFGSAPAVQMFWCNPRQFLVAPHGNAGLIDLDAQAVVCSYDLPKERAAARGQGLDLFRGDTAGRLWMNLGKPQHMQKLPTGPWRPLVVPDPKGKADGVLARAEGREYQFGRGATVQVEVDLGEHDRSLAAAQRLAALLQAEGYVIGPKGWRLRVSHEEYDTKQRLERYDGDTDGPPVVGIQVTSQLLAPDGTATWKTTSRGSFSVTNNKYVKQRRFEGGPNMVTRVKLDFQGQNPRTAMREDVLDRFAEPRQLPEGMPRGFLRAEGQYRPLPLRAELPVR